MAVGASLLALVRAHRGKLAGAAVIALVLRLRKLYLARVRRSRRDRAVAGSAAPASSTKPSRSKPARLPTASLGELLRLVLPRLRDKVGGQVLFLAAVTVLQTALNDHIAVLQGNIFKSVFMKNVPEFIKLLGENFVWALCTSALKSAISFMVTSISLSWRQRLYRELQRLYFHNMAYYKLSFVDKRIDSPEQILSTDVPKLCEGFGEIMQDVLCALFDGTYFTWRLARQTSPKWACVSWLYVVGAVAITRGMSPPFGKLQAIKLDLEQNLRKAFSNLATHCEAIAAFNGAGRELAIVQDRAGALWRHINSVVHTQWWFGIIEDFVAKYCASTVAMVVILGPFFSGRLRSDGTRAGNARTLASMRYVTSVIIHQLTAIGGLAVCLRKLMKLQGSGERVGSLLGVLREINAASDRTARGPTVQEGDVIAFDNVSIATPENHRLVDGLTFRVEPGTNMLITGPNGAGKSSIFRCLGGLWRIETGTISRPNSNHEGLCDRVFYLPQKPYNVTGNLREQLTYPLTGPATEALTTDMLRELLSLVDLGHLLEREHDENINWEEALSLGETQRLAMARLFYHSPTYAILDECTSAVSTAMEERLYEICRERGITCITISHRPALIAFHDAKLELTGSGGYTLESTRGQAREGLERGADLEIHRRVLKAVQCTQPLKYPPVASPAITATSYLQRLRRMLSVCVPSPWDRDALCMYGLGAIVLLRVTLSDRIAHLNGNTVRFLLQNDLSGFKRLVGISLMQCVVSAIIAPSLHYLTRRIALSWRKRLSAHLYALYFRNNAFYKANHVFPGAQHSDQRISEDLDRLTSEISNIVPDIIKPFVDLVWFTHQTWLLIGWRNTAALYTYLAAGLGFLQLVTPAYDTLVMTLTKLQAGLRHVHTRLRTHGESVAFFGGDSRELAIAGERFDALLQHEHRMARINLGYGVVSDFISKQLPTMATWVLSLLYTMRLAERVDLYADDGGGLGHDLRFVASAISHVFLAFGDVITLHRRVLELSGYTARVAELEELLLGIDAEQTRLRSLQDPHHRVADNIEFSDADIVTPDGVCLVQGLSLRVPPRQHLLLTGPNTSGKSSLFRVLEDLWPLRRGYCATPVASEDTRLQSLFLVPQRPYNVAGTLGDQITYPVRANLQDPAVVKGIEELMSMVGLAHLRERYPDLGVQDNWADVLSLGEQQRLGMARLFHHRPKFAILDQCTDAVSVDVERQLYDAAAALGITIVTASQRPALVTYHAQELRLVDGRGSWELSELQH